MPTIQEGDGFLPTLGNANDQEAKRQAVRLISQSLGKAKPKNRDESLREAYRLYQEREAERVSQAERVNLTRKQVRSRVRNSRRLRESHPQAKPDKAERVPSWYKAGKAEAERRKAEAERRGIHHTIQPMPEADAARLWLYSERPL